MKESHIFTYRIKNILDFWSAKPFCLFEITAETPFFPTFWAQIAQFKLILHQTPKILLLADTSILGSTWFYPFQCFILLTWAVSTIKAPEYGGSITL